MIFKKRKYRLNNNDRIEDLSLILFTFVFFSYAMFLCGFGALLNVGVIMANEGRMPVLMDCELSTQTHFSFQNFSEVNYPLLSDIIEIKSPFSSAYGMVSIGDLSMLFAFFLLLSSTIYFSIKIHKFNKRIKKKYE